MKYECIDCDQHVIEPPDLWENYLPARYQERAPQRVTDKDGGDAWLLGDAVESLGLVSAIHKTPETLKWTGARYDEMHPGCFEPGPRLALMDEDGVSAAVFFPPQRTMIYFMSQKDEFGLAGMQAYNNFIRDFCNHDRSRLGAIWQMPAGPIETSVAEMHRAAENGAVGVGLATWPSGGAMLSETEDAFWAAAEEMGMPIHIHIGLVAPTVKTRRVAEKGGIPQLVQFSTTMSRMPVIFAEFIFNGVFDRFPKLTIVGGEVGAGWVPFFKQELDDRYRRNRVWTGVELSMMPSELYLRNCKVGVVSDQFGVQNCEDVGVDTMMWCSDLPHHITDFPNSQKLIETMSAGIDPTSRRKIFCENAGNLYGFLDH
jgi:predicted TIM-barrel fold metal-dependent hydrolase